MSEKQTEMNHKSSAEAQEKNKYFTPQIEDIRIGYECEIQREFKTGLWEQMQRKEIQFSPKWDKVVIGKVFQSSNGEFTLESFEKSMEDMFYPNPSVDKCKFYLKYNKLKTAYLTKEQIEAEGWRFMKEEEGTLFFNANEDGNSWIVLEYSPENSLLEIYLKKVGMRDIYYYSGSCPSVNELRTIVKLLKIKQ